VDDEHEEKVSAEKMKECQVAQAPELAEIFSDAATCVVLLRRYLSQAQWVGTLNGALIFEKDGVLYPLETTTPVRESATAGAELLSLGSLFAIATFHGHLGGATPKLLKSLKAKKLPPSRHLLELADYLLGRRDTCCLLLSSSKAKEVSPARPSRTVLPKGSGEPTPLEELKSLPGQVESDESEVENESSSSSDVTQGEQGESDHRPKTPPKAMEPAEPNGKVSQELLPLPEPPELGKRRRILDLRSSSTNRPVNLRDLAVVRARLIRPGSKEPLRSGVS
ncbi:unnamed protein product, partial [Cladocopium goreaui]